MSLRREDFARKLNRLLHVVRVRERTAGDRRPLDREIRQLKRDLKQYIE